MHQKYVNLFKELTHATEVLAEQVMEYDKKKDDQKGAETAQTMRDDFVKLYDKIRAEDFSANTLTKAEYAKILVAAMIIVSNLETRITNEQNAVKGYKETVIPKLERIIDECDSDEAAQKLAEELFTINEAE